MWKMLMRPLTELGLGVALLTVNTLWAGVLPDWAIWIGGILAIVGGLRLAFGR